jgi:hypothetical protein
MIWLTWRQLRTQASVIYAALGALAVILVITGVGLADLSRTTGSGFFSAFSTDDARTAVYTVGYFAVIGLPAIIGIFWGAPLVTRELEAGTHRLVWNQTVTRTRWLATKVGFTGLAAMVAVALLSLLVTWWCRPIDAAVNTGHAGEGFFAIPRLSPAMFDARGIAPIGHAAFAFALGVTAGMVVRRMVPAMAITLAVFVAVQIAMPTLVRPHLAPAHLTTTITAENLNGMTAMMTPSGPVGPVRNLTVSVDKPGAWIIANQTVDPTGTVVTALPSWVGDCVPPPPAPGAVQVGRPAGEPACFARLAKLGYRQRITYQPAGRYWAFQAYETAIFVALALLLIGFSFWWLRHRLS